MGDSGIAVEATISPTCPGPATTLPNCAPKPFSGELEVTDQATRQVVAGLTTDEAGHARAALEPGSYLVATPDPGPPSAMPVSVEVSPGAYSRVEVMVDSGLR